MGAGVAGLEAARRLTAAHLRVLVVEARDRPGGRIHTVNGNGRGWEEPVDAGAEFVHGRHPGLMRALKHAGVRVNWPPLRHRLWFRGQHRDGAPIWKQALDLGSTAIAEAAARAHDLSAADAMQGPAWQGRGNAAARALARDYVAGFNAATLSDASVRALAIQQEAADGISGDRLGRPRGGFGPLVDWLARPLIRGGERSPIRLSTVVEEIVWRPGHVELHARGPTGARLRPLRSRAAIVTLPLGVLQARAGSPGAVRFRPDLPDRVADSLASLRMGAVIKVIFRFRDARLLNGARRRGGPDDFVFVHALHQAFPTFWIPSGRARPIVVAWAGGPAADRLRRLARTQVIRRAVATLAGALGTAASDLAEDLDAAQVCTWTDDPFARGAYSYVPVGAAGAAAIIATPIDGTLFFAGEATDTGGFCGTVHGALASGERVADDVGRAWTG